ncbi:DUF6088 family protein [Burkholderia gladioli]|uniref:DUF6088 family protein n=1 Tax=Burkholderia gladioli TaxID=28095 RepID=UPI002364A726|nr:DUF6088 family protein [Burkholderia gladioli]MDD1790148.1 DUF6088 family protein [Burkholderia gladioli]
MRIEDKIVRSIRRRRGVVVLRSEVAPLGSTAQVSRVLAKLVGDGRLVRVSKGVYAKTRINKFTGKLAPAATFESIAAETFRKLHIDVSHGRLAREYNAGTTTQIPMDGVVSTGARRINRKIKVGNRTIKYEKARPTVATTSPPCLQMGASIVAVPHDFPWDTTPAALSGTQPKLAGRMIDGKFVAGLTATERFERWNLCEDLAQQLVAVARKDAAKHPQHSHDETLQRVRQGMERKGWVEVVEMDWLIKRLRIMLGW